MGGVSSIVLLIHSFVSQGPAGVCPRAQRGRGRNMTCIHFNDPSQDAHTKFTLKVTHRCELEPEKVLNPAHNTSGTSDLPQIIISILNNTNKYSVFLHCGNLDTSSTAVGPKVSNAAWSICQCSPQPGQGISRWVDMVRYQTLQGELWEV